MQRLRLGHIFAPAQRAGHIGSRGSAKRSLGLSATTKDPWRQAFVILTVQESPWNGSRTEIRSSVARPNPRYQRTRSVCAVEGVGATRRGEAQKTYILIKICNKTYTLCAAGQCIDSFLTLTAAPGLGEPCVLIPGLRCAYPRLPSWAALWAAFVFTYP